MEKRKDTYMTYTFCVVFIANQIKENEKYVTVRKILSAFTTLHIKQRCHCQCKLFIKLSFLEHLSFDFQLLKFKLLAVTPLET